MQRSVFHIERMDCAAEEHLVRMRLQHLDFVDRLDFDLASRSLAVYHTGDRDAIRTALDSLHLGTSQVSHEEEIPVEAVSNRTAERKPLIAALAINAVLFLGEMVAGLVSHSMGLVADSLDMLADALVYGMSLAAVGGTLRRKKQIAGWSGYFQLSLAVAGLLETARRFFAPEEVPVFSTMILVSAIALAGNVVTLLILSKAGRSEAHMQASWIFTSNDIKVNLLVIASGLLVLFTASSIPDLLAGGLIFLIVAGGARKIIALAK